MPRSRSHQRKPQSLLPPVPPESQLTIPIHVAFPTFEAYLAQFLVPLPPDPIPRQPTLERGPIGFWSGSWPSSAVFPSPALPNDPVDLLLFVLRIVTDEQHLTASEMASPAYAGPVTYVRTIIDAGDIVTEIPEVPHHRLAELRRAAEDQLRFYSCSTHPITTTRPPVATAAASAAERAGGAP